MKNVCFKFTSKFFLLTIIIGNFLVACGGGNGGESQNIAVGYSNDPVQYDSESKFLTFNLSGDMNNDGLNDLVSYYNNFQEKNVLVIRHQNATGSLELPVKRSITTLDNIGPIFGMAIGDLNNDGLNDLAITARGDLVLSGPLNRLFVFYQDPNTNTLLSAIPHVLPRSTFSGSIVIGDINGDNLNDVVTATIDDAPHLKILYQQNDNTLSSPVDFDTPVSWSGKIFLEDMDNDNDLDVIVQSGNEQISIIKNKCQVGVCSLDNSTILSLPVSTQYWGSFDAFTVGDINQDGYKDILAIDPAGSNAYFNIYYYDIPTGLYNLYLQTRPGNIPDSIHILDIDGDGKSEIIGDSRTLGIPYNLVHVMLYERDSNDFLVQSNDFSYRTDYSSVARNDQMIISDINGDGLKDAVINEKNYGTLIFYAK